MPSTDWKSRDSPEDRPVTAEDLTSGAATKAVLKRITNSPTFVYPTGVGAAVLTYAAIAGPMAVAAAGVAGIAIGLGSWVIQYFFLGEKMAQEHVSKLRALAQQQKHARLEKLAAECAEVDFHDGAKEARDVDEAFKQFLAAEESSGLDPTISLYLSGAQNAFEAAVATITQALELYKVLRNTDSESYEREIATWKTEIRAKERKGLDTAALRQKVEAHQKTLESFNQRTADVEKLLAEVNDIESALVQTHIELSSLRRGGVAGPSSTTAAVTQLETAVRAARRTEERLRGLGTSPESDQQYIDASRK